MRHVNFMRIVEGLKKLAEPGLKFTRLQTCVVRLRKFRGQRRPRNRIHRNRRPIAFLHEIINPQNVRMNELPSPLHFLPESAHRFGVTKQRRRDKMERHLFTEHIIHRQPDLWPVARIESPGQLIAIGEFLSCRETGTGTERRVAFLGVVFFHGRLRGKIEELA